MHHLRRLSLFLFLCAGVLSGVSLLTAQEDTPTPTTGENCAITLDGQKFHTSGGGGGMLIDPSITPINLSDVGQRVFDSILDPGGSPIPDFSTPVAILIADDFTGTYPDNLAEFTDPADLDNLDLAHGWLVYEHFMALLETLVGSGFVQGGFNHEVTDGVVWDIESTQLWILRIDTQNFDTLTIINNVKAALAALRANEGIDRFVVNMSFTVLPCATIEEFLEMRGNDPDFTFEEYAETIVTSDPQIQDFADWIAREINIVNAASDPLQREIAEILSGNPNTVFVAAAGNFGDIFKGAFYPGAWPEVVSVSGEEFDGRASGWIPWIHSNIGDVIEPAAWYSYKNSATLYAGTSFGAPVMSLIAALHLTAASPACPFDTAPPAFAGTLTGADFNLIRNSPPC